MNYKVFLDKMFFGLVSLKAFREFGTCVDR